MERAERNKKRKQKKIIISLLSVILIFLIAVISYGGFLTYKLKDTAEKAHRELKRGHKSELRVKTINPKIDNFSVLFMGVDERKGQNVPTRTDALILATFNKNNKSIKLVSIPRDSYVQIVDPTEKKDYGMKKITEAHAYGDARHMGDDFTIATVEKLFDVPVDYYFRIDFQAFTKIVDSLGGVTVDVPVRLVTQDSKDRKNAIILNPGVQTLNGEQALAFVRNRKSPGAGDDFGRGQRQMDLIKAIVKKSASLSSITKYDKILNSLNGHIVTNFSIGELISLHNYAGSVSNIDKMQLKGTNGTGPNGEYIYEVDPNSVKQTSQTLKNHLGLKGKKSGLPKIMFRPK